MKTNPPNESGIKWLPWQCRLPSNGATKSAFMASYLKNENVYELPNRHIGITNSGSRDPILGKSRSKITVTRTQYIYIQLKCAITQYQVDLSTSYSWAASWSPVWGLHAPRSRCPSSNTARSAQVDTPSANVRRSPLRWNRSSRDRPANSRLTWCLHCCLGLEGRPPTPCAVRSRHHRSMARPLPSSRLLPDSAMNCKRNRNTCVHSTAIHGGPKNDPLCCFAKISITDGTFSAKFYTHMYSKIHIVDRFWCFISKYTEYGNIFITGGCITTSVTGTVRCQIFSGRYGHQAFTTAGPNAWNTLPSHVYNWTCFSQLSKTFPFPW